MSRDSQPPKRAWSVDHARLREPRRRERERAARRVGREEREHERARLRGDVAPPLGTKPLLGQFEAKVEATLQVGAIVLRRDIGPPDRGADAV